MRRLAAIALLPASMLAIAGCSSGNRAKPDLSPPTAKQTIAAAPKWYLKVPQDSLYLLGAATATSRDMQTAIDKAQLAGRSQIAQSYESHFQGLAKRFQEEVGVADSSDMLQQFEQTYKAVADVALLGTRAREQEVKAEGPIYRVYVLMEMPIGPANAAIMRKLRQNQQMYTRLRASQAFQELEHEVDRVEKQEAAQAGTPDRP